MKMITLTQDNNWKNKYNRRGVEIREDKLDIELKLYFGWKTPTKYYGSMRERLLSRGSRDHDGFINHLIEKGE